MLEIPFMPLAEKALYIASFQIYKEDNDKATKEAEKKGKRGKKK